jgi:hypothetical protein
LVEFEKIFINLYNFSFKIELILVPFTMLIALLNFYLNRKEFSDKKFENLKKLVNTVLILLGLLFLSYSFYRAITDIQSFANMGTLISLILPVAYAVISLPYMYILKLYSGYENLFLRLKLGRERSKKLNLLIRLCLILFCNLNVKKLEIAANMNNYNLMSISSKDEIDIMIKNYKSVLLRGSVKSDTAQTRPTWITLKTPQALASANKSLSETIMQFPDSKKEELMGYMTEHHGAKEVRVVFIPPSNNSLNGLLAIDYYVDTTPTRTGLNDNIANIVTFSESLAEESGISNPNVSVCAMTMDGNSIGYWKLSFINRKSVYRCK